VSEIVFEIVSVGLEHVERFVPDLPSGTATGAEFGDSAGHNRQTGDEAVVVCPIALPIQDFDGKPVDDQRVIGGAHRHGGEPPEDRCRSLAAGDNGLAVVFQFGSPRTAIFNKCSPTAENSPLANASYIGRHSGSSESIKTWQCALSAQSGWPLHADAADQAAPVGIHFFAITRFARTQDYRSAMTGLQVLFVDWQEVPFVVVSIERRNFLAPMHGVVDVRHDALGRVAWVSAHTPIWQAQFLQCPQRYEPIPQRCGD